MNTFNLSSQNNYGRVQSGISDVKNYELDVVGPCLQNIVFNGECLGAEEYNLEAKNASPDNVDFNSDDLYNSHTIVDNDISKIESLINEITTKINENRDAIVEKRVEITANNEAMAATDDPAAQAALASRNQQLEQEIRELQQDIEILENTKAMYDQEREVKTNLLIKINNIINTYERGYTNIERLYQHELTKTEYIKDKAGNVVGTYTYKYNLDNELIGSIRNDIKDDKLVKQTYYDYSGTTTNEVLYEYDEDGNVTGSRVHEFDLEGNLAKTTALVNGKPMHYITYERDEYNHVTSDRIYDCRSNQLLTERYYDEFNNLDYTLNRDKDGYLTDKVTFNGAGQVSCVETYELGKLIKRVQYDEHKNIISEENF